MKHLLLTLTLGATACLASPAQAAQVGVSISVNQPGLYGRIDLGAAPPPPAPMLIYSEPVVMMPGPVAVVQRPIYLHVPPGHYRDWRHNCYRYNACGQPVYFVRDDWARSHGPYGERWREERREDRREDRWEDRHDHGHR